MSSSSPADNDEVITWIAGIAFVLFFGPLLLAHFMPDVASFLLQWHILTTRGVVLPLIAGGGLDFLRLLIAGAVLLVLVLIVFASARSYLHARKEGSRA